MSDIVIVDSNILLNVLDVPAHNQDREAVFTEFEVLVEAGDHLLLPMAAVLETADHIADLSDGRERRRFAIRFRDRILEALRDDAPWCPSSNSRKHHVWPSGWKTSPTMPPESSA